MKAIFCVGFFNVHPNATILAHFRMDNFSVVVKCHEGGHHIKKTALLDYFGRFRLRRVFVAVQLHHRRRCKNRKKLSFGKRTPAFESDGIAIP